MNAWEISKRLREYNTRALHPDRPKMHLLELDEDEMLQTKFFHNFYHYDEQSNLVVLKRKLTLDLC